ncbi:hypothetical protein QLX08_010926 [Tetragonisca angustula]|uniref:Uncharacterized protein n=1 Tax=Tetragonisca angustula TaxID=166442 RepID=A0AAW0ZA74_9HYME
MSSSGYRGRSFGPRGARTNGPANGFNGPRFPHPTFNHPRPPHRLSGPNFAPWQQNKNFHPQYRGNLQYHPNSRGRAAGGRGILRFSGSGRPPLAQFHMGFVRTPVHTASLLPQKEQVEDESVLTPQTPLLGSEEERQQKIAETADKLKKKLSSITEEELTNFWEDDLSVLPNNEEEDIPNRGIPELRHDPPELDLTFTDFKDIGRIDCNNLKCGNLDSKLSNEISISFEKMPEDNVTSTNNEIIIIDESREEPIIILDSCEKDDLNQSNVSAEDDKCREQTHHELPDLECNVENLQLQSSDITGNLTSSNVADADEKSSTLNVDENITNLSPTESVDNSLLEKILDVNDVKTASTSVTTNNQDELKIDFPQDRNTVQADVQDQNSDNTQNIDVNVQHNDHTDEKLLKDDQIQNSPETNVPQEVIDQNVKNVSEEIHLNIVCDPASSTYLNYNEANNKLNDDKKLNSPLAFQSKVFNVSPRFTSRTGGPRCHWTFQQNVTNSFFRGPQRLSFQHSNRISPPKHVTSFKPTDLVSVGFHPRTLPPFIRNISVSSHDTQHNSIVPFSSNDLPPAFDPSEPPPNIKSKSGTDSLNKQESLQSMPQKKVSQNISKVIEPSSAFDPRGPPSIRIPYVSVTIDKQIPGFNPQQPPPKIHKREKTLQPPPIFDPRLFPQERSSLVVPLDASRSNVVPLNLMETSSVPDFNFPRLSSINIPSHRPFVSNVQMNFPSVMSQASGGQGMTREFSLRLPPMTITEVPPPPLKEPSSSVKGNSNPHQGINMDDGLEDMQEAMEFAKQIMNLTEEAKNRDRPVSESALTPAEIPVPIEIADASLSTEERNASSAKKQRRKESKSKKNRQDVVACGPELSGSEKQEGIETADKGQTVVESQSKGTEDALLSNDQIRPKVVFNLNSKTKKIHKAEEWHRAPLNVPENRETSQQGTVQNLSKDRSTSKKHHPTESRNANANQSRNQQQKEVKMKRNSDWQVAGISAQEKSNNAQKSHCHKSHRDSEKLQENATTLPGNVAGARKSQKPREEPRKESAPTSESLWKSRVISRFLKMSKNDICNMVNNSSLRKFDIAMKHLVKERKSSLSLELRNVEDEKMKEYDRIEFMNQLNAMLDPSAVVGITDLPTEFIHHLSEVLQLDIPFDASELPQNSTVELTNVTSERENSSSDSPRVSSFAKCPDTEEHNLLSRGKEDPDHRHRHRHHHHHHHHHHASNDANSGETESAHKKQQQQPLFNEADLDDILSQVAERTRTLSTTSLPVEPIVETQPRTVDSNAQAPPERIANRTVADLDDIFSAGIVRARQLGNNASVDHTRARKSSSADRNSSLRREPRWSRKAREDPDTFRNLTKEEWEAKYGDVPAAGPPPRWTASSSAENLSKRAQRHRRHCFSDSPARRSSISPLNREVIPDAADRCVTKEVERSESSSSSSLSDSESDRDGEEAVAPDVTKLLKVIKEKEKIAKKRSLNETIRDEVAAEIEKEWKEKSRHRERRSRKRERRKRDRREKRRRERRRRKRRRDSHSSTRSRSRSDTRQVEEFRLLTEDEIKKEAREECCTASTVEGSSSSSTGEVASSNNNASTDNKASDSRNESQGLRAEKDQQVSTLACNEQTRSNKPSTVVSPTQPKTKAQLKQMPESSRITEEVAEIARSAERTRNPLEVNREANETTAGSCSEQTVKDVQTSRQAASLSVKESISNNTTRVATHTTDTTSSTVSNGNVSKHDQRATAAENKGGGNGHRKIDIKAYKERALQRRLKELDATSPAPLRSSHAASKSNVESRETKTGGTSKDDASQVQTGKYQRLIKARSATTAEECDKGTGEMRSCSQDVVAQKVKGQLSVSTDSNSVADPVKSKEHGDNRLASRREFVEPNPDRRTNAPTGLNPARRRPRRPITSAVDSSKFKNIRSEGNKELKLIKEKARCSSERRKRRSRFSSKLENSIAVESKKAAGKGSEKPSLLAGSRKHASRSEIEKKRIDDRSVTRGNNHVAFVGDNRDRNVAALTRVDNETIVPNRQVVSEKEKESEEEDGSLASSAKRKERNVMSVESTPVESSNRQTDACNDASSTDSTPLGHDESIPAEKCMRGAAPPAARESHHLLSERIDVDIEKHGHRINVRNFKNDEASSGLANPVSVTNVDGTSVVEKTVDSETARGERDRSDDSDEVRDKARSPSPCSPFKGFLVDTVDNDIYQLSRLCRAGAENEGIKENLSHPSQRLQTNQLFNDESVVESGNGGNEKVAGNGVALSISNLEGTAVDDEDPNVKDDGKAESEEATREDDDRGYDPFPSGQKKFLSVAEITDDHDTFNEDSEPFIVLDEYIDDTDGRSIEKFNCLPHLDIFTIKPLLGEKERSPNFDQHECSRSFDKDKDATTPVCENERATLPCREDERALELFADKDTTNTVFSSISASNVEFNSETAVPECPAECSQNVVDTTKDISQKDDATERQTSVRERKIEGEKEDVSVDDSPVTSLRGESSQKLERNENVRVAAPKAQQVKEASLDLASTTSEEVRTLAKELTNNSAKSGGKEYKSRALNNVKNKPRMKRKREKRISREKLAREAAKVKQPTTKEAVMARMIEIDVEIHKLMTEKMTLYQMLTSDSNSQQSNAEDKEKLESPVIRPQTPSLMSQLLQNIDTAPATKAAYEKDSPNKSKTLGKHNHNHHAERKESCVSVYDSENEEVDGKSSRKRKRQKAERSVKRLDADDRKQIDDNAIRVTCKKDNNARRAPPVEQGPLFSDQISTSETTKRLQEDVGNDSCKSPVENEKVEIVPDFNGENRAELARSSVEKNETSSRESNDAEKLSESKTPERLSIYSDDSTWDSFLQNSGADDQRKPSTGLALLEETYRKEMAKARRMRERMRKRKKKKLGNTVRMTVNALTSDEEELPLATLYAKKLHRKRKLLDSSDCTSTARTSDPQLWKNVVEVINAVAENRTDDLYAEEPSTAEKISTDTETTEAIVLNSVENVELKNDEEKQMADTPALNAIEGSSTEPVKISDNDSKTDDPRTILSDKSQELPNSEHSQQDLEKDLPEAPTDQVGLVEFSVQETVASDSVENINDRTTTEDLDSCNTELNSNNIPDDRCVSNVSERPEKLEEKIDVETKKSNLKDESIVAQGPIDRQFVTKPKETKRCSGVPLESDSDRNVAIADEITSKNKPDDSELVNASESNVQDPLPLYGKDNAIGEVKYSKDSAIGESNCVPQDRQHFLSHREHREPRKRKDTERFDKTASEENNNQSSSRIESTEVSKEEDVFFDKKLLKRKRASKIPVRRSSRYTEDTPAKRIKVEADTAVPIAKQDEKNFRTQFPCVLSASSSPCEELESILVNPKKCRVVQKPAANRKRCTPTLSETETAAPHELSSESFKEIKRHRKHTMFEMLNCVVRLVDCRETILCPNVSPSVLQKYGITRVNTHYTKSPHMDALASSTQSTLTKDSPTVCAKQTPPHEPPQSQASKSMKKIDDVARCATDQTFSTNKVKRVTKPAKVDLPVNDTKEYESPDTEVMPVLVNELVTMDIAQNCENSDVEIVEERAAVIESEQHSNSESPTTVIADAREDKEQARTQYTVHKGPILDIKVFENSFLAASEDGRIYSTDISKEWMFSGSLDGTLRCYNIMTGIQVRDTADIGSPIQCMDEAWGIIFIGTKSGHVSRYHMKTGVIKGDSIQFSDKSVLALKATNEGPRRVLIVASRSQPITIRDAQSGLFLRTICGQKSHTVYSLMRNNNLIYCGTSSTSIPVFDFTNGEQTMQYNAGVGIVCMRLYKQLLFAGCYDGNIYVFDTKDHHYLCSIPGPGNMLLSMEVIDNKIIAGSKDKRLQSWQMPRQVRSLLQKVADSIS